jgi:hypothetical protein
VEGVSDRCNLPAVLCVASAVGNRSVVQMSLMAPHLRVLDYCWSLSDVAAASGRLMMRCSVTGCYICPDGA